MPAKQKDPSKLFDFMSILFEQPKVYEKLRPYQKARHFFMVNRFMSITEPVRANYLQHLKINPAEAVNFWQSIMTRLYKRTPSWMYTKTKKAKQAAKKTKFVEEATVQDYCQRLGYSRRQIDEALEFFPEKMSEELKKFERIRKQ